MCQQLATGNAMTHTAGLCCLLSCCSSHRVPRTFGLGVEEMCRGFVGHQGNLAGKHQSQGGDCAIRVRHPCLQPQLCLGKNLNQTRSKKFPCNIATRMKLQNAHFSPSQATLSALNQKHKAECKPGAVGLVVALVVAVLLSFAVSLSYIAS